MDKQAVNLQAQIDSLVADIKKADGLLSKGDSSAALVQIREAASRASKGYLDCIGRAPIKQHGEPVAVVMRNAAGQIFMARPDGNHFDLSRYVGQSFYTQVPTIPEGWKLSKRYFCTKCLNSFTTKIHDGCDYTALDTIAMLSATPQPGETDD